MDKKTLSVTSVNDILSQIPEDNRLCYNEKLIESLYIQYQSKSIEDKVAIMKLTEDLSGKKILLLGPGSSIGEERDKIEDFISNKNPVVVVVNIDSKIFKSDYIFISNAKRYNKLVDTDTGGFEVKNKLIATSNITLFDRHADYVLNYSDLMDMNGIKSDNALLLSLAALSLCGVTDAFLAGFDGFQADSNDYFDPKYLFAGNDGYNVASNEAIISGLKNLSDRIHIHFLTGSLFERAVES